jgi:HlyD family secretion protein
LLIAWLFAVDIIRPEFARKKKKRLALYIGAGLIVLLVITIGVSRLSHAAPVVEHSTVWSGSVRRGEMLREVQGLGSLVPIDTRWISADTSARVDKIVLQSGTNVKPDSVILELSDAQLEHDALDAEYAYKAAKADLANLKAQLANELMAQKSAGADIHSQYLQAKLQTDVDTELVKDGIQAAVILKKSNVVADQLAVKDGLVHDQLEVANDAALAQVAAEQAHLEQRRVLYELKKSQLDALHVRAGLTGVISALSVEAGQQVTPGMNLVRVADPSQLKATIQIPETEAKDVAIGQEASIDTHNEVVGGRVTRVDAAVVNGKVAVDISFAGPQPKDARADLSVDGTVVVERLRDVLYLGRPVQVQPNSTSRLFKVLPGGDKAIRVTVKFGQGSLNTIEVVQGLAEGDQVILSDMSAWETYDRIRLD